MSMSIDEGFEQCQMCKGFGREAPKVLCSACRGTGQVLTSLRQALKEASAYQGLQAITHVGNQIDEAARRQAETAVRVWSLAVDWGFLAQNRREPKPYTKPKFWRDPFVL